MLEAVVAGATGEHLLAVRRLSAAKVVRKNGLACLPRSPPVHNRRVA